MGENDNITTPESNQQAGQEINYEKLYEQASAALGDLTAERDSLKAENEELRSARDQAIADGQKAREMNYTLSRQLDISTKQTQQPEEILAAMFLKGD